MEKQTQTYDATFEKLYDVFIDASDTECLLSNINIESLESFLRATAKCFYQLGRKPVPPFYIYIEKEGKIEEE